MKCIYQFSDDEWSYIVFLYEKYENYLPLFLQDVLSCFFSIHEFDKKISNESELYQLSYFVKVLIDYFCSNSIKEEIKNNVQIRKKTDCEDIDGIIRLNETLNTLINIKNMNKKRRTGFEEGRKDEY